MATTWAWATVSKALVLALAMLGTAAMAATQPAWVSQFLQRWQADSAPHHLWLLPPLKQQVADILGHPYPKARLPWWRAGTKTLWVLEEIGKEQPITAGIVIERGHIVSVEILKFRESRGGEIQLPAFRRQFQGARLTEGNRLNRPIDGISGATLSVRAVRKLARMALLLDAHVRGTQP